MWLTWDQFILLLLLSPVSQGIHGPLLHLHTEHKLSVDQAKCLTFVKHPESQHMLFPRQHSLLVVWLGWQGQPGGPTQSALMSERWQVEKILVNAPTSTSRWRAVECFPAHTVLCVIQTLLSCQVNHLCTACKWFEIVNDMFLNNCECFHGYIFKIFHRWFGD